MQNERSLCATQYRTVSYISGPLLFVEQVHGVGLDEIVEIAGADGVTRVGQVLEVSGRRAIVQVFSGTRGLDVETTGVTFSGENARLGVSKEMLGRMLNGAGEPIDGGPAVIPDAELEINGRPINPFARDHPSEFIQTGISAIDGLNTLVRGQKLPIFSGYGLPANEIAAQIAAQARVPGTDDTFAVVFAALGITHREASFFIHYFETSGVLDRTVLFLNLADSPTIERLMTPRAALTAAEYLAFQRGMHVLVIITDMTNYAEALREVATAREEVPGRRGFPGYMYSDLATLYERAGRIKGQRGSITQVMILSMPDDDMTHPIPDLTGYITEGQIVLSRDLHRRGIYPPIDALRCLSRLMNAGIGAGRTRQDHRSVADQLYSFYAQGCDLRRLVAIIGEAAVGAPERRYLAFAGRFEQEYVGQGRTNRTIAETLECGWDLLSEFPPDDLKRISTEHIAKYRKCRSQSP